MRAVFFIKRKYILLTLSTKNIFGANMGGLYIKLLKLQ